MSEHTYFVINCVFGSVLFYWSWYYEHSNATVTTYDPKAKHASYAQLLRSATMLLWSEHK